VRLWNSEFATKKKLMSSRLERACLELLAKGPQTAAEVCRALEIAPGTVYGVLSPLRESGQITVTWVMPQVRRTGRPVAVYHLATSTEGSQ